MIFSIYLKFTFNQEACIYLLNLVTLSQGELQTLKITPTSKNEGQEPQVS